MRGAFRAFNGLVQVALVRAGADFKHPLRDPQGRRVGHTFQPVYTEMLLQICRDYPALPDPRTLKAREIRFFYEGLRAELKEQTKPKG